MPDTFSLDLPYAFGKPEATGVLRSMPEDFFVEEVLGFSPEGEGEHVWLWIEKRNCNTEWVAEQLARLAGVPHGAVSYSGLKDRVAVTRQWFSVHLPGKDAPEWSSLNSEQFTVKEAVRHRSKLRRGTHRSNRFVIRLREVAGERAALEARLAMIARSGVPNYFGEQRFGHQGGNLDQALKMFGGWRIKDRHKRSMYLSAARSYLFNQVLARRVVQGSWDQILPGEAAILAGSHSFFVVDEVDAEILRRVQCMDIHPSGPMWGRGDVPCSGQVAELERVIAEELPAFRRGLEGADLRQERRALRLQVMDLEWHWSDASTLELRFGLGRGEYATAVVRELAVCTEIAKGSS
ncbi:MAG: tRNA pseudouridine(13) synthase TruD [Pseudomonadota bacterium]